MQGWKNADFSYNDLIWARCGQNSSDISLQEVRSELQITCEDISVDCPGVLLCLQPHLLLGRDQADAGSGGRSVPRFVPVTEAKGLKGFSQRFLLLYAK